MLQPDNSNKYKVSSVLKDTIVVPNSIPFLRDPRNVDNRSFKKLNTIDVPTVGLVSKYNRRTSRDLEKKKVKELGWT